MSRFEYEARRYPTKPGCYLIKDASGEVIYVGKAKNMRRRLASYFRPHHEGSKLEQLAEVIADIEVVIVNNETESLVMENNLIKRYQPRFNGMLRRADTGYNYIVLTDEQFPMLYPYRKNRINKQMERIRGKLLTRRFGPYLSYHFRNKLLEFVSDQYQMRTCHPLPEKACLRYHIGKCGGICEGRVSLEQYAEAVAQAVVFLSQSQADLIQKMKDQMLDYAEKLEFEKAQWMRAQIEMLENALEPQVVERDVHYNQDVIYFGDGHALVMPVDHGAVQKPDLYSLEPDDRESMCPSGADIRVADNVAHWLLAHYAGDSPEELIINQLGDPQSVERALSIANGSPVKITIPEDGDGLELLKLCEMNYNYQIVVQATKGGTNGPNYEQSTTD